ncbi:endolytic transglycosylase MltG [Nocardioides marmorisolisilvae]|uniref:Endolytic murein transglycosylase n=1 Tax=Nocardioides marmorisolisilvae TaxID=1542737 RepID=A0A3N0DUA3_9ACTN|nr:endolytic transglycosylase MltG [Nocardioides marmorisolisilvae]RNL79215.1 endolytic transglycosylase MltG [Nocardioides marmorisolisilvae]
MSDIGVGGFAAEEHEPEPDSVALPRAGSRRAESTSRTPRGCIPMLLVLVLVIGGAFLGGGWAVDKVKSLVGVSADYAGPGSGSVVVQVHSGDSSTAIAQTLKDAGVVKSVGAFTDAARADSRSRSIQVGYYQLKKQMKAKDALAVLINPKNLVQALVVVPEGYRVKEIVKAIAKKTDITAAQLNAALKHPAALGLPASAGGKVEGYLFPATYSVVPGETASELLKQMIAKTKEVTASLDLAARAKALGYTPEQILTIASILEYEGSRDQDYPKIARAIYNRLDKGMALQSDATVAYANNLTGTVYTTDAQRQIDSPYNTYKNTGLPPGPIGSPGEKTIEAALHPAKGSWLYWVVVNLKTGETRFADTFAQHQANVNLFHQYCQTSDAC